MFYLLCNAVYVIFTATSRSAQGDAGAAKGREKQLASDAGIIVPKALEKCAVCHLQLSALIQRLESENLEVMKGGEGVEDERTSTTIYGKVGIPWFNFLSDNSDDDNVTHGSDGFKFEIGATVAVVGMVSVPCVCSIIDNIDDNRSVNFLGENHPDALYDGGLISDISSCENGNTAGSVKWLNLFFVKGETSALFVEKDGNNAKIVSTVNWGNCKLDDSADGRKLTVVDMRGENQGVIFEQGRTASVWFEDGDARNEANGIINDSLIKARKQKGQLIRKLLLRSKK